MPRCLILRFDDPLDCATSRLTAKEADAEGGSAIRPRTVGQVATGSDAGYDAGMTRAKIAITLPRDQLARVHREIRAGRAESVSGYIAQVLAGEERRDSLRTLLRDLIEQHGEPEAKDIRWAERALAPRRRA